MKKLIVFSVVAALVVVLMPLLSVEKANAASSIRFGYGYSNNHTLSNPGSSQETVNPIMNVTDNADYASGFYMVNGCGVGYESSYGSTDNPCTSVPVMSGPGSNYPPAMLYDSSGNSQPLLLLSGMKIYIEGSTPGTDINGDAWLQIRPESSGLGAFGEVRSSLWIDSQYVQSLSRYPGQGNCQIDSSKWIEIDYSNQTIYVHQCSRLAMNLSFNPTYGGFSTIPYGSYEVYQKSNMVMIDSQNESQAYFLFAPATWDYNANEISQLTGLIRLSPQDSQRLYNWLPNPQSFEVPVYVIN